MMNSFREIKPPLASVIVPTYHSWDSLKKCVSALARQTCCDFEYEIIIANNDPEDSYPDWISEVNKLRIVNVSKAGSYSARNAAAKEAKGAYLCFTDSDCVPDLRWLSCAVNALRLGGKIIVAGMVKMVPGSKKNITAVEAYDIAVGIRQDIYATRKGTAVTANLSVTKEAFNSIGGFDCSRLSGGDTDFCKRLSATGVKVKYVESACVAHPARNSLSLLIDKAKRLAGGKAKTNGKEFSRNLFFMLMPPVVRFRLIMGSDLTMSQKLKATSVLLVLKTVQIIEFISVLLGKKARR